MFRYFRVEKTGKETRPPGVKIQRLDRARILPQSVGTSLVREGINGHASQSRLRVSAHEAVQIIHRHTPALDALSAAHMLHVAAALLPAVAVEKVRAIGMQARVGALFQRAEHAEDGVRAQALSAVLDELVATRQVLLNATSAAVDEILVVRRGAIVITWINAVETPRLRVGRFLSRVEIVLIILEALSTLFTFGLLEIALSALL